MTENIHTRLEKLEKLRRLKELQAQKSSIELQLPHLYGYPWYKWAKAFFESDNKMNLLCAANQISKSSTQIRKCIHWATAPHLWPKLWLHRPRQFWYVYPSSEVASIEVKTKWEPEFLPRVEKDHPLYGYKIIRSGEIVKRIDFNTGVSVVFKQHTQDQQNQQTATVDAIFADEELPEDRYDEMAFRLVATSGYFHMVFTATLGQETWRRAMEPQSKDEEAFSTAFKQSVSMYDCLEYEDGSATPWTKERIENEVIPRCKSQAEVQRRVFGRFIRDEGRQFWGFDLEKNLSEPMEWPPKGWVVYCGVDIGSGGKRSHPAAILYLAVDPECKKGVVFRGWRGDQIETSNGDILEKYMELSRGLRSLIDTRYDWQSKDFGIIANRVPGLSFNPANKSREAGLDLVNTLFRQGMLTIVSGDPELGKLVSELNMLQKNVDKSSAKDDFSDALRYACMSVPWDFDSLHKVLTEEKILEEERKRKPPTNEELMAREIEERRGRFFDRKTMKEEDWARVDEELWDEWNNQDEF
jgi:phage terminase large subunit-like protein